MKTKKSLLEECMEKVDEPQPEPDAQADGRRNTFRRSFRGGVDGKDLGVRRSFQRRGDQTKRRHSGRLALVPAFLSQSEPSDGSGIIGNAGSYVTHDAGTTPPLQRTKSSRKSSRRSLGPVETLQARVSAKKACDRPAAHHSEAVGVSRYADLQENIFEMSFSPRSRQRLYRRRCEAQIDDGERTGTGNSVCTGNDNHAFETVPGKGVVVQDAGHTPKLKRIQNISGDVLLSVLSRADNPAGSKAPTPTMQIGRSPQYIGLNSGADKPRSSKKGRRSLKRSVSMLCGIRKSKIVSNISPSIKSRRLSMGPLSRLDARQSLFSSSRKRKDQDVLHTSLLDNMFHADADAVIAKDDPESGDIGPRVSRRKSLLRSAIDRLSRGKTPRKNDKKRHKSEHAPLLEDGVERQGAKSSHIQRSNSDRTIRRDAPLQEGTRRDMETQKQKVSDCANNWSSVKKDVELPPHLPQGDTARSRGVKRKCETASLETFETNAAAGGRVDVPRSGKPAGTAMSSSGDRDVGALVTRGRQDGRRKSGVTISTEPCEEIPDNPFMAGAAQKWWGVLGDKKREKTTVMRTRAGHTPLPPRKRLRKRSYDERLIE